MYGVAGVGAGVGVMRGLEGLELLSTPFPQGGGGYVPVTVKHILTKFVYVHAARALQGRLGSVGHILYYICLEV